MTVSPLDLSSLLESSHRINLLRPQVRVLLAALNSLVCAVLVTLLASFLGLTALTPEVLIFGLSLTILGYREVKVLSSGAKLPLNLSRAFFAQRKMTQRFIARLYQISSALSEQDSTPEQQVAFREYAWALKLSVVKLNTLGRKLTHGTSRTPSQLLGDLSEFDGTWDILNIIDAKRFAKHSSLSECFLV